MAVDRTDDTLTLILSPTPAAATSQRRTSHELATPAIGAINIGTALCLLGISTTIDSILRAETNGSPFRLGGTIVTMIWGRGRFPSTRSILANLSIDTIMEFCFGCCSTFAIVLGKHGVTVTLILDRISYEPPEFIPN